MPPGITIEIRKIDHTEKENETNFMFRSLFRLFEIV